MNIVLAIFALFLLIGMVGDKNADNRHNFTLAFIACVAGIVLTHIF